MPQILIAILIIIVIIIIPNIKIVPQSKCYVIERLGSYHTTWQHGPHFKIPFIDSISNKVTLKEIVKDFAPQPVITKDRTTLTRRKAEKLALNENDYKEYFEKKYKDSIYLDCNTYQIEKFPGVYFYARLRKKDVKRE